MYLCDTNVMHVFKGFIGREMIKVSWAGPTIPNEDGAEDSEEETEEEETSTEFEGDLETSNDGTETVHPCDDDDGSQADEQSIRQREDNFTIDVDPIEVPTVLPHQEPLQSD